MTTFTFKINTVAKSIHDFTVTETRMGSLEIRVPYATSVSVGDTFEILENATTLLNGSIYRITAERVGPRQRKVLTCLGKTRVLYEKYCLDYGYTDYLSKDVGWIANDLVDHYFSGILTSVNVDTTTGVTSTHFNCDGMSVGAALEELARRGDCYFYVDDSDDVHFYVAGAESSGETVQGSSLKRIIVTDESSRHINKVIVRGRHRAIQSDAGSGYPERYFQDGRITSLAEAQEVADAMLAELNKDRKVADIILPSFLNVRAGTTLVFNSPTDGYSDSTENIQRVTWAFSTTRSRTTITIGDEEPTLDSVLAALARGANWNIDYSEVAQGTEFPANPVDGDLFKLTTDIEGYLAATYQYDSGETDWLREPIILRRNSDPPSGTEVTGDILERTDELKLYQWDGDSWEFIGTSTHGGLDNLEVDDHSQYHTSARHSIVDHLAAMLSKTMQPYNSSLAFVPKVGDTHDSVSWGAGVIGFADGTTQNINAGSFDNVAIGLHYVYFTVGSATLGRTTDYASSQSDTRGLLAWLIHSSDTDQEICIVSFYSKGLNIIADVVAAKAILSIHITTDQIVSKDFRTALNVGEVAGPVGIRFTANELAGYSGGTTRQFYMLASDGKFYAAGGTVVLDADGITVREQDFLLKDSGGTLRGRVSFYGTMNGWPLESVVLEGINTKGAALYAGGAYVWVAQAGDVNIRAPTGKEIKLYGDEVTANLDVNPNVSAQHNLGAPARKWDEVHADDLYGVVRYSDMHFLDMICPKCDEKFKVGDSLNLQVTGFEENDVTSLEMLAVPQHKRCPIIPRLRKILNLHVQILGESGEINGLCLD